jgi:hypothetical protein
MAATATEPETPHGGESASSTELVRCGLSHALRLMCAAPVSARVQVSGIDTGFDAFVTALSIAYGLMASAVVLPRRLVGFGSHR